MASGQQCVDIQNVHNVLLICLDSTIDKKNKDCRDALTQLHCVVNDVCTYTDRDECVRFIENVKDRKAFLIISAAFGRSVVPDVHHMSQVNSIFVFCENKKSQKVWTKDWVKIKEVCSEIAPLCEKLKQAVQQCEQNFVCMNFIGTGNNLDQLDSSFMHTHILKEILLTIEFEDKHIVEYLDYCRKIFSNNAKESKTIRELQRKYHEQTPIWWYTSDCFLFPMLNRALRLLNSDIIVRMGFFMNDLHRQVEQLHKEQHVDQSSVETCTVYRGQGLPKLDFESLMKKQNGLMSCNSFLLASKIREVSLRFAEDMAKDPDLVGILYVIKIDPTQSTTPYASIRDISCHTDEDDVLFSMHSVFRINDIKPVDERNLVYEIDLTLTSDHDNELYAVMNHIRKESCGDAQGWERLAMVLRLFGHFDKSKEIYETLTNQSTIGENSGVYYAQLASIADDKGRYEEALDLYKKSLAIYRKTLHPNHENWGYAYNNIGEVFRKIGDTSNALVYYEKSNAISKRSLPPDHPNFASTYNNMGIVYCSLGDYATALSFHEKALEIWQRSLPSNHPSLGTCYNGLGAVYAGMGNNVKALAYFEKDLDISQHSLPADHPDLAMAYFNIGLLYEKMNKYTEAYPFFERAVQINQRSLPSNHPDLLKCKELLRRVKKKL
ncbi:unnamed protein product [Adineta ricciae]|uniref:Kinesin light chain n=1 Tax=Adineta ricciae TaxID=249248 RepID=A0A814SZR9_ADIRI|nr:unnamed protein product [Adineta ricciae]